MSNKAAAASMAECPVPVIDLSPFFTGSEESRRQVVDAVRFACEKVGFMIIVGHGVPESVISEAWSTTRSFFDLPVADKREVPMSPDYVYGYTGLGDEVLYRSENASYGIADLKETFQICLGPETNPDPDMVPPRWPSKPDGLRPALTAYYRALEGLARTLLHIFALALNLPEDWFEDKIDHHLSALRCLNYPHQDAEPLPGQFRASQHTDYGTITILRQDDAPGGLQVLKKDGEWMDVKTAPDAFVINIGDLMQQWTNDHWRSTAHRVINPPRDARGSTRRQSMAFFHNINKDTLVECIPTCLSPGEEPKYAPITAGEHLMKKHHAAMGMDRKK